MTGFCTRACENCPQGWYTWIPALHSLFHHTAAMAARSLEAASTALAAAGEDSSSLPPPHLAKATAAEGYGFSIFFISLVGYIAYLGWLLVPASTLDRVFGLTGVPSKYWAVALPAYLCGAVLLAVAFYIGLNMATTPPFQSYRTYRGAFAYCCWEPCCCCCSRTASSLTLSHRGALCVCVYRARWLSLSLAHCLSVLLLHCVSEALFSLSLSLALSLTLAPLSLSHAHTLTHTHTHIPPPPQTPIQPRRRHS